MAQKESRFLNVWNEAHVILGLIILAVAFFMPIFGYAHHRIFKRRQIAMEAGRGTKPPGRTPVGRVHLWTGRVLIIFGVINGGLGIQLAGKSPFQSRSTTTKAKIAYGVVAGLMFSLYAVLVVLFELRRRKQQKEVRENKLPSYAEATDSDESRERGRREASPSPERPPIPVYG